MSRSRSGTHRSWRPCPVRSHAQRSGRVQLTRSAGSPRFGRAHALAVGLLIASVQATPLVHAQTPSPAPVQAPRPFAPSPGAGMAPAPDYGRAEYLANCASCHGPEGRGDGHFRDFLVRPPSDLTQLSRNNQGVFPVARVSGIIDGRAEVAAHGPREMPIWGADYQAEAATMYGRRGPVHTESYVRYRIQLLLGHLLHIQVP
jgi:mono/diheme cytochrome c family protein